MAEADKEGVLKRIAKATGSEVGERSKDILARSFPLLTAAPYVRAIQSLPGAGIASAIAKKANIVGGPKTKEKDDLRATPIEQESFNVLEKILEQVVEIRKVVAGPLLKEGFMFEPAKGRGRGGFKSLITGRYVKEKEAVAEEKPGVSVTSQQGKQKKGIVGTALRGMAVYRVAKGVMQKGVGETAAAGVSRVGGMAATAGRAAVGVAAGGLKLGAILSALAMFLPKDLKSVIGSIFEGLLEGLGFDKDTIEAIFTPFRILSDIADLIKKVIGLAWDGVKWLFGILGKIMDWFTSRSKVNASEEISKATGGTGQGEFVTGGEGAAETTPIPGSESKEQPPPKQTGAATSSTGAAAAPPAASTLGTAPQPGAISSAPPAASTLGTAPQPGAISSASPAPTPVAGNQAAPVAERLRRSTSAPVNKITPDAAPIPTPTLAVAPVAIKSEPVPTFPQKVDEKEAVKIHEWFGKPENVALSSQYDTLYERSSTIKKAIASTKALIRSETDPDRIKEHERILKEELEPGLEKTEKQRKEILSIAREAIRKDGEYADVQPIAPPPPTPSMATAGGESGGGESAGAGATSTESSGEVGADSSGGGGGGSAGGSASGGGEIPSSPVAELQPSTPTNGQQIDEESVKVESAREEMTSSVTSEVIENGEIAAGSVVEDKSKVPSPIAPREDLDTDIFFSAVA